MILGKVLVQYSCALVIVLVFTQVRSKDQNRSVYGAAVDVDELSEVEEGGKECLCCPKRRKQTKEGYPSK